MRYDCRHRSFWIAPRAIEANGTWANAPQLSNVPKTGAPHAAFVLILRGVFGCVRVCSPIQTRRRCVSAHVRCTDINALNRLMLGQSTHTQQSHHGKQRRRRFVDCAEGIRATMTRIRGISLDARHASVSAWRQLTRTTERSLTVLVCRLKPEWLSKAPTEHASVACDRDGTEVTDRYHNHPLADEAMNPLWVNLIVPVAMPELC